MTFEEFFTKKKIDIHQLAKAEPELYSEFKSHFTAMGEKSFDHTKKFWFNKLRRLYHLQEPAKAITQMEAQVASQAEPLSSPTIEQKPVIVGTNQPQTEKESAAGKPAAFKPRFNPRNIPAKTEVSPEKEEQPENTLQPEIPAPAVKKPGFRPRNIKPVSGMPSEDAQTTESRPGQTVLPDTPQGTNPGNDAETPKPAYKPKFNIRNIPKKAPAANEEAEGKAGEEALPKPAEPAETPEENNEQSRPVYKPKFNMKTLPKKPAVTEEQTGGNGQKETVPEQSEPVEQAEQTEKTEENKEQPKPAYKPKFNMRNLPKKAPEPENTAREEEAEKESQPKIISVEKEPRGSATTDPETEEVPAESKPRPAYKPRFNMKNIKPKSED